LLFKRGLRFFKVLFLLFLPNVPGAMFIQAGTFILDSRVFTFYWFFTNSPSGNFLVILVPFSKKFNESWRLRLINIFIDIVVKLVEVEVSDKGTVVLFVG
jgi:hypothetical protein